MKVELLRDTIVRFAKGATLDVSEQEGARLVALGNAKAIDDKPKAEAKPKAKTKKA